MLACLLACLLMPLRSNDELRMKNEELKTFALVSLALSANALETNISFIFSLSFLPKNSITIRNNYDKIQLPKETITIKNNDNTAFPVIFYRTGLTEYVVPPFGLFYSVTACCARSFLQNFFFNVPVRCPQQFAFYFFRVLFCKSAQRVVHCLVVQSRCADKFRMKQGRQFCRYPFALFAFCHCVCSFLVGSLRSRC